MDAHASWTSQRYPAPPDLDLLPVVLEGPPKGGGSTLSTSIGVSGKTHGTPVATLA